MLRKEKSHLSFFFDGVRLGISGDLIWWVFEFQRRCVKLAVERVMGRTVLVGVGTVVMFYLCFNRSSLPGHLNAELSH